eukprot:8180992-Pyramimonas_sp.AAC.2
MQPANNREIVNPRDDVSYVLHSTPRLAIKCDSIACLCNVSSHGRHSIGENASHQFFGRELLYVRDEHRYFLLTFVQLDITT